MHAQAGTQGEWKARPLNVMPTKVGIQRGDEGIEGTDSTCFLVFPQVGLIVRNDYNLCASFMFFWVTAFAGMTEGGLSSGWLFGKSRRVSLAGTPSGVQC